jgi:hypothetical protein
MNHFLTIAGIQSVGSVWATTALIFGDNFPQEIAERAHGLGKRLVLAWKNKESFPEIQGMDAPRAPMRRPIEYPKEAWPHEYESWKKRWGLE